MHGKPPYSQQDKLEALDLLRVNYGNVEKTAQQTGISERTLYNWKKELQHTAALTPPSPLQPYAGDPIEQPPPLPDNLDDYDSLLAFRKYLVYQARTAVPHLMAGIDLAAPYHRVLAFSELLKNINFIDRILQNRYPQPTPGLQVHYIDPQTGQPSDQPFWASDND